MSRFALLSNSGRVDASGKLWVLDVIKQRVAVFQKGGRFAFDERLRGVGYRSLDMQLLQGNPYSFLKGVIF
ncbi:MAG: hypothetical protein ACR2MC_10190 [Actinomycetota bacterium]